MVRELNHQLLTCWNHYLWIAFYTYHKLLKHMFHYHFSSFFQVNFNCDKICYRGFFNINTHLHLLIINITLNHAPFSTLTCTCFCIFHPSFTSFTSHAICQFRWGLPLFSNSPCFFSGLHLPKLQKPQIKVKQTFLPTLENKKKWQWGKQNSSIKGKEKKVGAKAPPLLKLSDGAHLHPKATNKKKNAKKNSSSSFVETWRWRHWYPKTTKGKKKEKKKGSTSSPYVDTSWWHPPTPKATKQKNKKRGIEAPSLLIVGDGA